jgi:tRNA 2-thiouridine synthesizing protein E
MKTFEFSGRRYEIDEEGFLADSRQWDEDFARGISAEVGITGPLTKSHWDVILSIRNGVAASGRCPKVYDVCKAQGLRISDLKSLFPAGYLRGACKMAGISYNDWAVPHTSLPKDRLTGVSTPLSQRVYRVDIRGFLIDPSEWDEEYAICKAEEMNMPRDMTEAHWKIIGYLRKQYETGGRTPTVYETCEANKISIEEMEDLFPDGYHRGAVKIAGLPAR